MNIRYLNNSDAVDWQEVSNLFLEVGWGARAPEQIKSAFQKSSFVRFAYRDDQLVGVGRTVDDGQYYAWIVDLAILPEFREKGIGRYILNELEKDLEPYISTMLTAAPGKAGFTRSLVGLSKARHTSGPGQTNKSVRLPRIANTTLDAGTVHARGVRVRADIAT